MEYIKRVYSVLISLRGKFIITQVPLQYTVADTFIIFCTHFQQWCAIKCIKMRNHAFVSDLLLNEIHAFVNKGLMLANYLLSLAICIMSIIISIILFDSKLQRKISSLLCDELGSSFTCFCFRLTSSYMSNNKYNTPAVNTD